VSKTKTWGTWLHHWALRVGAVALVGLSSGATTAAPLESVRRVAAAPTAPQGAKTAAIKGAIKVVVKALRAASKADVLALLVRFEASPAVRRAVITHAGAIATRLESLLKYETLVLEIIEDQVARVLKDAGVASSTAGTAGFYVKRFVGAAL
jgi:hypothetical protein